MKIAVPWPVKENSQERIKESLCLWEDKSVLLVCLVEPSNDSFLENYNTIILNRNSTDIGTKVAKCYIHDMVKAVFDIYPNEDWYGFGNSDCVPVGDIIDDGYNNYDILIYHRTDIQTWEDRFLTQQKNSIPDDIFRQILCWREEGLGDKQVARKLNRMEVPTINGKPEWTYPTIKELFKKEGHVFFWGQDMFLFKSNIVEEVIEKYLKEKDPILSTGGFDPRLSAWCIKNFNGARMLNKIFHKKHESEWSVNEVEYHHNGGDIPTIEQISHMEDTFLLSACSHGRRGVIPKYIKYIIGKRNPELYKKISAE